MYDDKVDELLACLCDCETYFMCEWHQRLARGDSREEVESDMEWELHRGHFFYIHGHEIDDEPHPEMLADLDEEVVQ